MAKTARIRLCVSRTTATNRSVDCLRGMIPLQVTVAVSHAFHQRFALGPPKGAVGPERACGLGSASWPPSRSADCPDWAGC